MTNKELKRYLSALIPMLYSAYGEISYRLNDIKHNGVNVQIFKIKDAPKAVHKYEYTTEKLIDRDVYAISGADNIAKKLCIIGG